MRMSRRKVLGPNPAKEARPDQDCVTEALNQEVSYFVMTLQKFMAAVAATSFSVIDASLPR